MADITLRAKVVSTLTPEAAAVGRDRLQIFQKLKIPRNEPVDSALVAKLSGALDLGERQTRTLIARYKELGTAEALAPARRGTPVGKINSSDNMLAAIRGLIAAIYLDRIPPADKETASEIRSHLLDENVARQRNIVGERVPSTRTLVRILELVLPQDRARTQLGPSQRTASEPHPGEYPSEGLLDLVQMDHTKGNAFLVDHETREEIGRPWITFIIEVFTRCILGFYVSMEAPSIYRVGRAIANAILPKDQWLLSMGLDPAIMPMHGPFRRFHHDGASVHKASNILAACRYAGIPDPDARPVMGQPHHGGHIERLIGTMLGKFRLLPAATGDDVSEREQYDPRTDAAMSLIELQSWLVHQVGVYHNRPHAGLKGRAPAHAWREATTAGFPTFEGDRDRLFKQFLPLVDRGTRQIKSNGIHAFAERYVAGEVDTWVFDHLGLSFPVHYDPYDIGHVYVQIGDTFVTFSAVDRRLWGVSLAEHLLRRQRYRSENEAFQASEGRLQEQAHRVAARAIVDRSIRNTRSARRPISRANEGSSVADLIIQPTPAAAAAAPAATGLLDAEQLGDGWGHAWRDEDV